MPRTAVDLFRLENISSPRMDHVRTKDIRMFQIDGETLVRAATGGISTNAAPGPLKGTWWRLASGYDHGQLLLVWNDHHMHWSWEPVRDMLLTQFQAELRASHSFFVRVA